MMSFDRELRRALSRYLPGKVEFMPGWSTRKRNIQWPGRGTPLALMAHHTAGARTTSTRPNDPGNRKGANSGIVNFVQNPSGVPRANMTLDRDGTVYVHSAWPVHHAGLGSFSGSKRFEPLGIPDNRGNDYMLGVEIVSRGLKKDFTKAQKESFGRLANACREAAGWKGFVRRLPNHRTWAPRRKIDTRYTLAALRRWASWYR